MRETIPASSSSSSFYVSSVPFSTSIYTPTYLHLLPFWRRKEATSGSTGGDAPSSSSLTSNDLFGRREDSTINEISSNPVINDHWPTFRNQSLVSFQNDFNELDQDFTASSSSSSPSSSTTTATSATGVSLLPTKLLPRLVGLWLRKLILSRTEYVKGLLIKVVSYSNREILRGKLSKIDFKFDAISFAQLYVSGGGRIIVKGLELKMSKFLFINNVQSIKKPYIIYADLLFTQQDIINSKLIRNLIQLLVDTILERVLTTKKILSASIRKVSINERRLHAQGTAKLLSDNPSDTGLASLDFEVSTSAGMRDQGQTLYLRDMQVVLNPDSILRTVMPIMTTSPIDIDLGEDCKIESLVIANKNVWIRAAAIISPIQPFVVAESSPKALYRYNFSGFLSKLLRINGGIAMKWGSALLRERQNPLTPSRA